MRLLNIYYTAMNIKSIRSVLIHFGRLFLFPDLFSLAVSSLLSPEIIKKT